MEVETYAALERVPGLAHGFTLREAGLDVAVGREEAVAVLTPRWERVVPSPWWRAEQVHGAEVTEVSGAPESRAVQGDGLVAHEPGAFLGILTADCAAVAVVDPVRRACGLFHSGRKGTELGIVPRGIAVLAAGGARVEDLLVQVMPCIRPPYYEVDFAAQIRADALRAGVSPERFFDCGTCTGQRVDRYYSYRMERGKTGRMLAFLGFGG